ncbi:urease accessory protein UreF [Bradyrhizobium sp. LM3.6]
MLTTTNEPVGAGDLAEREAAALYRLMTWLSPAFPVGGFSYSSGIEWAVEAGDIADTATLADWLDAMLRDGSGFCDATFLVHAYRATEADEGATLSDIAELAAAFVPSRERQLETTSQGRAFIDIARAAWDADGLEAMVAACRTPLVYPVAVGVVAAVHGVPLAPTLHGFLHALVSNWIFRGQPAHPARPDRQPARAGEAGSRGCRDGKSCAECDVGRSRQRDVSRRPRQPAARNAIYAAVQIMIAGQYIPQSPGRR